ncbi:hypothetical protein HYZ98_04960 [Candidatus Peregrinibacteria bacterium]|nr:hypothetical protein [Candidatus Peregrinibacteria bacterium]
MILVSNHALERKYFPVPQDVVIRVNVAWVRTVPMLEKILTETEYDIFLDYPQGRTKPPVPTIALEDTLRSVHRFPHVKYFAVSNVEDPEAIHVIQRRLPTHVMMVPKIETQKGVDQLEYIVKDTGVRYIMLDKEDLYFNIGGESELYGELVKRVRNKAKELSVEVLELHGVIFGPAYIEEKISSAKVEASKELVATS